MDSMLFKRGLESSIGQANSSMEGSLAKLRGGSAGDLLADSVKWYLARSL